MYKLSVPIMSATVNRSNREKCVQLCREAGTPRLLQDRMEAAMYETAKHMLSAYNLFGE